MKKMFTRSLVLLLLMGTMVSHALENSVSSFIRTRSQSLNGARKVSGEVPGDLHTHLAEMEEWYASFSITPAYQRSMKPDKIADCFFGSSLTGDKGCRTVRISGDSVTDRKPTDWLADNFYLGSDFDGTLSFKPTISSFILDFNLYVGLDEWVQGMYFRVYAPFVHTKRSLHITETVTATTNDIANAVTYLKSARDFFSGQTARSPQVQFTYSTDADPTTVTLNTLNFHKFNGFKDGDDCSTNTTTTNCDDDGSTKNGFGEIRAEFGWDFWQNEDSHLGLYLAAAAPTGNKAKSNFLFAPVVGNNKHWELGGGLTGHWVFWRSEDENRQMGIYTDTVVTHLFSANEHRVFDLTNNGPLSRYMLAAKMVTPSTNNLSFDDSAGNAVTAPYQFDNELTPIANLTAQDVKVSIGAQVDLAAWFNYTAGGFSADVGYNLWLQTCEKIGCSESKCGPQLAADKNTWVILGNSQPVGFGNLDNGLIYPLSFSQSKATINKGTNLDAKNGGVDNAALAFNDPTGVARQALDNAGGAGPLVEQINLSSTPIFLSTDDINLSQKNKEISHKVFGHLSYTWDREGVVPYFGIGGEAEFGMTDGSDDCNNTMSTTTTDCSSDCMKCAVSQWSVWAKFGLSFN